MLTLIQGGESDVVVPAAEAGTIQRPPMEPETSRRRPHNRARETRLWKREVW